MQRAFGASRHQPEPPTEVGDAPPRWARTAYKLVAIAEDGCPVSVFDGATRFPLGRTVFQQAVEEHGGGLYVYMTIYDALRTDTTHFPRTRIRLPQGTPLGLAKVLAW